MLSTTICRHTAKAQTTREPMPQTEWTRLSATCATRRATFTLTLPSAPSPATPPCGWQRHASGCHCGGHVVTTPSLYHHGKQLYACVQCSRFWSFVASEGEWGVGGQKKRHEYDFEAEHTYLQCVNVAADGPMCKGFLTQGSMALKHTPIPAGTVTFDEFLKVTREIDIATSFPGLYACLGDQGLSKEGWRAFAKEHGVFYHVPNGGGMLRGAFCIYTVPDGSDGVCKCCVLARDDQLLRYRTTTRMIPRSDVDESKANFSSMPTGRLMHLCFEKAQQVRDLRKTIARANRRVELSKERIDELRANLKDLHDKDIGQPQFIKDLKLAADSGECIQITCKGLSATFMHH